MIEFEWGIAKAQSNVKKHGILFEEAKSVFYDEYARQFFDEDHSESEERFILLGLSDHSRVLDQSLINLYLRDCMAAGREPDLSWK
ncbi:BrnT family toxin [Nitrosococcus oceani]|uniref:BrnT family toxin n=2 Tax=Nitrosococcus oceani TaxID=1229 RepID=Q3J712_NITOC|nr:BrnT family toxin [Nitrosococcus oceani]KFI18121.1 hypothetical protein IB75_15605 [Nitrosococcus oceani C-27]ABA59384.1 conserved hypothetical protein [Nitrosococcus oceani ATCC 19707]EDZ65627.1 hypothetical protein NOC27_2307 [Nitrosococcus oceani AFC27]KFI21407.1 hypothetical protein HW44_15260 [Nitrosococcus oceani]GEM20045.1 hypothetical protein NONS58_14500 [Nitrosococcus oceani]